LIAPLKSSREALAALGPSGIQDAAAANGGHPGAETVPAFSDQVAGLKCSFHSNLYSRAKIQGLTHFSIARGCIPFHYLEVNGLESEISKMFYWVLAPCQAHFSDPFALFRVLR
jgi:hypothetical protein